MAMQGGLSKRSDDNFGSATTSDVQIHQHTTIMSSHFKQSKEGILHLYKNHTILCWLGASVANYVVKCYNSCVDMESLCTKISQC